LPWLEFQTQPIDLFESYGSFYFDSIADLRGVQDGVCFLPVKISWESVEHVDEHMKGLLVRPFTRPQLYANDATKTLIPKMAEPLQYMRIGTADIYGEEIIKLVSCMDAQEVTLI
jgi:hypothetical protein